LVFASNEERRYSKAPAIPAANRENNSCRSGLELYLLLKATNPETAKTWRGDSVLITGVLNLVLVR